MVEAGEILRDFDSAVGTKHFLEDPQRFPGQPLQHPIFLTFFVFACATRTPSSAGPRRMIDAGEVFAEIDSAAGTVRFLEDPQRFRGAATLAALDAQIAKARDLAARVAAADHEVMAVKFQGLAQKRSEIE